MAVPKGIYSKNLTGAIIIIACGLALVLIFIYAGYSFSAVPLRSELFHSALETSGAVCALFLAVLLNLMSRSGTWDYRRVLIATAMASTAVLDFFHAIAPPDSSLFIWFRTLGNFSGALIISLVYLPWRISRKIPSSMPFTAGLASMGACLIFYLVPTVVPVMSEAGRFSFTAGALNVFAGALFFAAGMKCFRTSWEFGNERVLYGTVCLLFSAASFSLPFSRIWYLDWWVWHGFRLTGFTLIFFLTYAYYHETQESLLRSKEELEVNVAERTAKLKGEIKERLRAEAELIENENRLKQILEAIPVGIFAVDSNGGPLFANSEAKNILGKGIVPGTVAAQFPEVYQAYRAGRKELYPPEEQPIVKALKGDRTRTEDIEIFKDGERVRLDVMASPVLDSKGSVLYAIAAFQDITEKKRAEGLLTNYLHKLEALNKEMEGQRAEAEAASAAADAANRAKSDFLANMSHELRTPLNSVLGFSELLSTELAGPINEEQKEYLNDILESGRHLLNLINDILDLAKVEAGKMGITPEEFDPTELVASSAAMFREKSIKHRISFETSMDEDVGFITADQMKIRQILFNLLSNAFKFTPDGGKISVRVAREGPPGKGYFEFSVKDTGIGISEEDRKRLFHPFQQLETQLSRKRPGTGLGLSLCKRFVELHGGTISVDSSLGAGSTFRFTLPETIPEKGEDDEEKGPSDR